MMRFSNAENKEMKKLKFKNLKFVHILISVFDGGLFQALGANSAEERDSWLQALQLASYECMRSQLLALQQRIEAFSGHKHDTDIHMLRLQRAISTGNLIVIKLLICWYSFFFKSIHYFRSC